MRDEEFFGAIAEMINDLDDKIDENNKLLQQILELLKKEEN